MPKPMRANGTNRAKATGMTMMARRMPTKLKSSFMIPTLTLKIAPNTMAMTPNNNNTSIFLLYE